jgi:ubiquinone/menaquinone biosynthesis C-methylase UbiE
MQCVTSRVPHWDDAAEILSSLESDAIFAVTAMAAETLLDTVHVGEGTRVLDVGCGPAIWCDRVLRRGAWLVGTDLSHGLIRSARQRFPEVAFVVSDATQLPFASASFDAVTCNVAINAFPSPEQGAAEALRVLRPGGHYAFTTWCDREQNALLQITYGALKRQLDIDIGHRRSWTRDDAEGVLRSVGFTHIDSEILPLVARVAEPIDVLHLVQTTGKVLHMMQSKGDEARRRTEQDIFDQAELHRRNGMIELATPLVLARGTRPMSQGAENP